MSFLFWKEVPEIGLKVHLVASYGGSSTLGCYSSMISNICVQEVPSYMASSYGQDMKWLESLNKDTPLLYGRESDKYSEYYGREVYPPPDALKKWREVKTSIRSTEEFLGDEFFTGLANHITGTNPAAIYLMGDVINRRAPAKNSGVDGTDQPDKYLILKTADFARYLIKSKYGYVLESPIVQNPNHRTYGNYSLNQVWLWVPPEAMKRSINVAAQHGEENFPTHEQWLETVTQDITALNPYVKKAKRPTVEEMFESKKFPEDNRFKRGAAAPPIPEEVTIEVQKLVARPVAEEESRDRDAGF